MFFALSVLSLVLGLLALIRWLTSRNTRPIVRRPLKPPRADNRGFMQPKPPWVPKAVVRLKALMPYAGCRHVAVAFNSRYAHRGESVGKSALIVLKQMRERTTISVLRVLLDCFERFGRPRFFRTDNEGFFASPLFTAALFVLGIRHQRIDPYSPWQNGRIERLFWTLKERLFAWWEQAGVPDDVQPDLDTFRVWYDHVRPHQGLAGLTPAEAWSPAAQRGRLRFFSAWDGILSGFGRPT